MAPRSAGLAHATLRKQFVPRTKLVSRQTKQNFKHELALQGNGLRFGDLLHFEAPQSESDRVSFSKGLLDGVLVFGRAFMLELVPYTCSGMVRDFLL